MYYTTRKHINDTYCKSVQDNLFQLTDEQKAEIERFKKSYQNGLQGKGAPIDTSIVGSAPARHDAKQPKVALATLLIASGDAVRPGVIRDSLVAAVVATQLTATFGEATSSFLRHLVNNIKGSLPIFGQSR